MCRQHFSCEQDARQALARYQQSCRVLTVSEVSVSTQQHYRKAGRPAKETLPERVSYYFHGMPSAPVSLFEAHVERAQRPNAKWMFELFLDVHPLFITTQDVQVLVMNLKDELRQLLTLLEPPYIEAYS